MAWRRWPLVYWAAPAPRWPAVAAALALVFGVGLGLVAACGLQPVARADLAGRIFLYVQARAAGQGSVLGPALGGWLRAAAPVFAAGLLPLFGVPLVLLALCLHGFALGLAIGVAGLAGGGRGLGLGLLSVLPGNTLALPTLCWLGQRAVALAASRGTKRGPIPASYLWVGAGVLAAVAISSVGEAALSPLLLRAAGALG